MSTGTAHHYATLTPCISSLWPLDFCSWFSSKPSLQMSLPMRSGEIKTQGPLNPPPFISLLPCSLFHSWSGARVLVLSLASTLNWCSLPQCPHPARAPHYIQFSLLYFWFTSRVRCPSYSWQRQPGKDTPACLLQPHSLFNALFFVYCQSHKKV